MKKLDKKLLQLLYFLALNQKYMNSVEIANKFNIKGKKVTDRTIRRWLSFLRKTVYFSYYLDMCEEAFGLMNVCILTSI
ncbi:MAG: hypothetical protein J7K26_01835, partial [Candidatus Aenigmarchaeota archaeon]|nr:hypothetical protein [Candidatus Aenigmarchaeota archaeon]